MAESKEVVVIDSEDEKNIEADCPICLQTCSFPTRLPCGHVFCFLCVKGVANKNRKCALCRKDIPIECLEHPELVGGTKQLNNSNSNEFRWFYEGRNGWWQYDDRTSQDIEEAYQKTENTVILVAGNLYAVDFEGMTQLRSDDHSRRRRRKIKRDLASVPKKGVAGLRLDINNIVVTDITPTTSESVATSDDIPLTVTATANVAEEALLIAAHIIDSTLAYSQSSDETGRDVSQIFDESSDLLLEGIRSLNLHMVHDSSDSENENIF